MPTLNWIGKQAVVEHHKTVPTRLLVEDPARSHGDPETENLIVEGDNLLALKALLPRYAGQVKCIYIDPPYNTGNEGWVYNDAVNSAEMRSWLGQVVGRETEDLSRQDKWLCMMYPRLVLLRDLLSEGGSLWMSIDDNSSHLARGLLDEIFGATRFVASIVWQKKYAAANDSTGIPAMHDYILVYAKSDRFERRLLPRTEKQDKAYRNPDGDKRGPWKAVDYTCNKTRSERPNLYYPLRHPATGKEIWPKETRVWAFGQDVYQQHADEKRLWWGSDFSNQVPALKRFLTEVQEGILPVSWWPHEEVGHTDEAKKEVIRILDALPGYITPKPIRLIERILQIATIPGDLVLDSFAGSGTTGHAVLQTNASSPETPPRRFIMVEMEKQIVHPITAERVRRVIDGYDWQGQAGVTKHEPALGGGFRYCTLGPELFDPSGQIDPSITFPELARFVYFAETGQPLSLQARLDSPLLGVAEGRAVYLLYNGILKDRTPEGGNILTRSVLESLPVPGEGVGQRVIYGAACRLSANHLREASVMFRQIPYDLHLTS